MSRSIPRTVMLLRLKANIDKWPLTIAEAEREHGWAETAEYQWVMETDTCQVVLRRYGRKPARIGQEDWAEAWPENRADTIGQNGNDGDHYAESAKPATIDDMRQAALDVTHPYHTLALSLVHAYHQATAGKGAERHANDLPFDEQRMRRIAQGQGHIGGLVYQVCKKAQEAEGMSADAAHRELCGVIVYAAGAMAYLRDHEGAKTDG